MDGYNHESQAAGEDWRARLVCMALDARKNAYTPYSDFKVGAALLCADGSVVLGCNIENAAYGPSNCAERTAVFGAVAQGKRKFKAIAIVGGREDALEYCPPCGVCRQVLAEFCSGSFEIILGRGDKTYTVHTLSELLPYSFGPGNLL